MMSIISSLAAYISLGSLILFHYRPKIRKLLEKINYLEVQISLENERRIQYERRIRSQYTEELQNSRSWRVRSEESQIASIRSDRELIEVRRLLSTAESSNQILRSQVSTLEAERNALREQLLSADNPPEVDEHFSTQTDQTNPVQPLDIFAREDLEARRQELLRQGAEIHHLIREEESRRVRFGPARPEPVSSTPDIPPFQWIDNEMFEAQRRFSEESQRNILRGSFGLRHEFEFPDFVSNENPINQPSTDHTIVNRFGRMTDLLVQPNSEIQPINPEYEWPVIQERRTRFQRALLNLRNIISPAVYDALPWEEIIENLGFHGLWDDNIDGAPLSPAEMNSSYFENIQQQSQQIQENQEIDYLTPEEREMTEQITELNAVIIDKTNSIVSLKNLIKEFHTRVVYQETETDKRRYRLPVFIAFIAEDLLNRE